jgi:hypothetical protein
VFKFEVFMAKTEIHDFLGFCAMLCGDSIPTIQETVLPPSSALKRVVNGKQAQI